MLILRQLVKQWVENAILELQNTGDLPPELNIKRDLPNIVIENTKSESHGDFATNFALASCKLAKTNPRDLAQKLKNALLKQDENNKLIDKIEIAGPGFINFFLAHKAFYQLILDIDSIRENYGRNCYLEQFDAEHTENKNNKINNKIHIEFLSANPTGPLHVGHGRHAAYGMVASNLLEFVGFDVHREYYINDAGRQMQILAVSLWLRYLELCKQKHDLDINFSFPKKAYQGKYVKDIAVDLYTQEQNKLADSKILFLFKDSLDKFLAENNNLKDDDSNSDNGDKFVDLNIAAAKIALGELNFKICLDKATNSVLTDIKEDLAEFGVHYDNWFSEDQMIAEGAIPKTISYLESKNLLYKKDGAIWFKTSEFGDEKDRVLIRSNGQHTYFAPDISYHLNKLERGYDIIFDILGSDHHGYVPRLRACLRAFEKPDEKFITKLVQFVHLYRGDEKVQMSTRSGEFITLRELRDEVGNDAVRFYYVMRKLDQVVDFDIELAKSKSSENPVYYVQYAHARICSVMRQLAEKGFKYSELDIADINKLEVLTESLELDILRHLSKYIDILQSSALSYEPHRLAQYVRDLSAMFHKYYNSHMILVDDKNIRDARLSLILAVKQIITNILSLLGVSSPEEM